jgi:pilus assembly protein FimV
VAVASTLLAISANAGATGLGKLTVLSALGQPLRAEIELTSPEKEDVGSLVPKLASIDAFKQANIDYNPALATLRFAVEQRGSGYVVRVTSSQPINEPFVDMLMEMNSSNGKLLREYTFLLDPAELRSSQAAQVASPVSVNRAQTGKATAPVPAATVPSTAATAPQAPAERKPARTPSAPAAPAASGGTAGEYTIKSGDTLSKIAGNYRSEGVSLDQLLVSLYKANPDAFAGKNMNRLKVGQILAIPDAESARATSNGEAHSVVMAHATDFNAYRNKLAGQVASAPAEQTGQSKQGASGSITAKVKEVPTATSEATDKLKLSKAEAGSGKQGTGKASEEDKLAKDKQIADANARVKELEKNVGDLQKLLDVKNKDLAAKQAAVSKPEAKPAPAPTPAPAPAAAAPEVKPAPAPAVAAASASAPAAAASASASAPVAAAPVAKPAPKRKVLPPPPPPEPGFFDSLTSNPFVLPGGIGLLAVLGGYGIFASRRKKKLQQFEDSVLTGSSMKANSMFGSTGGQSVDTNNSVFNSNFAPSASQLDANEVDPVAEADVYIAYGRDSQAEEILKEALRTQPDRHAVRVKLLEIYANRKDTKSFERLASELYGMTGGKGEEWAQAASLGIALEPGNPLYAGGKAPEESTGAALGSSTHPLEELDPDALLANSLSKDMLESISVINTAAGKPEAAAPEEHALDMHSLDFDLDIPGEPAATHTPPAAAEFEPMMDAPVLPTHAESAKPAAEPAKEEHALDFSSIDFDLGEPAAPTHAAESVQHVAHEVVHEEHSLKMDEHSMDFAPIDLPAAAEPKHEIEHDPAHQMNFESAGPTHHEHHEAALDIPMIPEIGHAPAKHEATPASHEFDLSSIDLDLGHEAHGAEQGGTHHEAAPAAEHGGELYNAEMATKLDLAVAYHEIGDKEGARELLDEVVKGGTPDQIQKARTMLAELI